MKPFASLAALVACLGVGLLQAAPPEAAPSAKPPKIALVLSGGGARGLAHVGVLKVLRDQRIAIDFIVATSMGSIVGGAYAAGRTPEELEALVKSADWPLMFSDRPPREDLSFRRKEDDLRFIGKSELGLGPDGITLPRGAFGAQNLEEFLRLLSQPASDARHLDELPIPLRAVATDLVTGELVILRDVPLSIAMRASMSVPGAFAPTKVEKQLLGDGGLTRNLPVEVARELGADVIIAVNVGTPLLPRERLSSALGVAQQMINILTEQNVSASLKALRPTDILISPELGDVTFVDFDRGVEIVARGEAAGKAAAARLAPLALSASDFALWEARRVRRPALPDRAIHSVRVEGAVRTNPEALLKEVRDRADVAAGQPGTDEQLLKASRVLHGTGEFERVDVRPEFIEGRKFIVIDVEEKSWGPNYLRFGVRAVSDFHTDSRFSLTVQHTRTWLNAWGAEWRNELQIGDTSRLTTSLFQPLGAGSAWFVEPLLEYVESDFDLFNSINQRTDRVTTESARTSAVLGRRLGNIGVARLEAGYEQYRTRPAISSRIEGTTRDSARYVRLGANFDTLDDANFPRRGYLVSLGTSSIRYSGDSDSTPIKSDGIEGLVPVTFDRLTLLGLFGAAHSRDDRGASRLGGFFNLSGTPSGAVTGSQAGIVGAIVYYRMGELPRALGGSWYAGFSLEAGNAWARRADVSASDLKKAGSLFLGFDTIAGPLYLGAGHTAGGDSALYLYLGRPADRNP